MTATTRAQIVDDYMFQMGGISFRIAEVEIGPEGYPIRTLRVLLRPETADGYIEWHVPTEEERMVVSPQGDDRSIFRLPEGCGEALLEALSRHYNRGQPTADARAYYELWKHEADRRDKAEEQLHGALIALLHLFSQTSQPSRSGVAGEKGRVTG